MKERTLEEADELLDKAKLHKLDFQDYVQSVYFNEDDQEENEFCIIEFDEKLIGELKEGHCLTIRGEAEDEAVLCTDTKTYAMLRAQTSNSLLVAPSLQLSGDTKDLDADISRNRILGVKGTYFELRRQPPKLNKIHAILSQNYYEGEECENSDFHALNDKYTFEDLQNIIQASTEELNRGLKDAHACIINGFCRILDFNFINKVLENILSLKDTDDFDLNQFSSENMCKLLKEVYSKEVLLFVLREFSNIVEDGIYSFDEDKICKHFAELLLRTAGQFNLKEFLNVWKLSVPDGFTTYMKQLGDMTIIDRQSMPTKITYFPCSSLPVDPQERFDMLFAAKPKWTYNELIPFLSDIVNEMQKLTYLLSKYTRSTMVKGEKLYNTKRQIMD